MNQIANTPTDEEIEAAFDEAFDVMAPRLANPKDSTRTVYEARFLIVAQIVVKAHRGLRPNLLRCLRAADDPGRLQKAMDELAASYAVMVHDGEAEGGPAEAFVLAATGCVTALAWETNGGPLQPPSMVLNRALTAEASWAQLGQGQEMERRTAEAQGRAAALEVRLRNASAWKEPFEAFAKPRLEQHPSPTDASIVKAYAAHVRVEADNAAARAAAEALRRGTTQSEAEAIGREAAKQYAGRRIRADRQMRGACADWRTRRE